MKHFQGRSTSDTLPSWNAIKCNNIKVATLIKCVFVTYKMGSAQHVIVCNPAVRVIAQILRLSDVNPRWDCYCLLVYRPHLELLQVIN